jgi:hypothetical protein
MYSEAGCTRIAATQSIHTKKQALKFSSVLQQLPAIVLGAIGAAVVYAASQYRTGTLTAMGPGFMPVALGLLLMLLAGALLWPGRRGGEALRPLPLRPVLCVAASIVLWTFLAERAGFFPAAGAQLLLGALALRQHNWRGMALGIVVMSTAAYGLFVLLLRLPLAAFGG